MFCERCGKEVTSDQIYCKYCGNKLGGGKTSKRTFSNFTSLLDIFNNLKEKLKNIKFLKWGPIIIGILLIFIIVITPLLINSSPKKVTESFFKAIYKEDVGMFLKCFYNGDIRDEDGELYTSKEEIKRILALTNIELKKDLGEKWFEYFKVTSVGGVETNGEYNDKYKCVYIETLKSSSNIMITKKNNMYYLSIKGGRDINYYNHFLEDKVYNDDFRY